MAKLIQAITKYRPRIKRGQATNEERYMELITQRTTLSGGVVKNVQESRKETLTGLLLNGGSVHTGGAVYSLSIDLAGNFTVNVKPDKRVSQTANAPGAFRGTIINAENIGKTNDDLIVQ